MKRILILTIAPIAFGLLFSCNRVVYQPETPAAPSYQVLGIGDSAAVSRPGGLMYALPKSRLDITIYMKRTEMVKGPFSAWAGKYLGIDNVINSNGIFWEITDIAIRPIPIPDTTHLYYVALGAIDTASFPSSLIINMNSSGFLTGVWNSEESKQIENTSIELIKPGFSSVFKYYAESNLFETTDTVVERIAVDSVMVEKTILRKKMVEKPAEQRAKEAADFIQKLKDQRISLLTGYQEVPYDQAAIRYMAEEIEKMERDYIELFTGLAVETSHKKTVGMTPEIQDNCIPVPVARFSAQEGLLPVESNKGELIYIQICAQGVAQAGRRLIADVVPENHPENNGFVYRIPEWSLVTLWLGARQQKEFSLMIPQFGTTARLPWFVTNFVMDPETGAVTRIIHP
ncbi:MAG: DUF4831 family protein [Bacteroidales bacterium]